MKLEVVALLVISTLGKCRSRIRCLSHHFLYTKFEASLSYTRPCLKMKERGPGGVNFTVAHTGPVFPVDAQHTPYYTGAHSISHTRLNLFY